MKLQVRIRAMQTGRFVMLCDEAGEPLPNQVGSALECRAGEMARVKVEFAIDGEVVVMIPSEGGPGPRAEKSWPVGLPADFEGLDVIDLDTGVHLDWVLACDVEAGKLRRLKTDADGDLVVDPATGRAVEEKLSGRFRLAG